MLKARPVRLFPSIFALVLPGVLISALPVWSQTAQLSGGTASTVLQGDLHSSGQVMPSLTVTPGSARPVSQSVQQFAAGAGYHPGQAAPIPPPPPPKPIAKPPAPRGVQGPAGQLVRTPVVIAPAPPKPPPRWNYTMTPGNGIMTWEPGHAVGAVPQKPRRSFNLRYIPDYSNMPLIIVPRPTAYYQPRRPAASSVAPLSAVAQTAQMARGTAQTPVTNWSQWYKRVSATIYDQWRLADVCPGTAKVHVNVWRSRDLDCQVADFEPARDVTRNAAAESRFKELALQSVNSMRKTSFLDFPLAANQTKISFDMEFKRDAGATAGCQIKPAQ